MSQRNGIAVDDWRYETICECELPEYFDIFFKENKVTKVVFSAPRIDAAVGAALLEEDCNSAVPRQHRPKAQSLEPEPHA